MRHTLKHKAMSLAAIFGLLAALLCPAGAMAANDPCTKTSNIQPYTKDHYNSSKDKYCVKGSDQAKCQSQLQKYAAIASGFLSDMKTVCAANDAALKAAPATDSQGIEKAKGLLKSGEEGSHKLADTAAKRAKQATDELNSGVSELANPKSAPAPKDPAAMAAHNSDVQKIRQKLNNPDDSISEKDVSDPMKPKVGALKFGSELRKLLVEAQREFNSAGDDMGEMKKKLEAKDNGPASTDTTADTNTKKGGGLMDSLNPSALMGLATAGMGLAAAMKKNPNNSSVSSPSDTTPPAQAVAATGLGGDNKAASQSPNMSTAAAKTETPNSSSGGSPGFGTAPFAPESDVTSKGSRLASTGNTTPASSSSGGLEGFGGSTSSRSPDSAGKESAAALAKNAEDPGAGSFNGGGGGGGGGLNFGSSSSSTSSDPAHAEDPLKETLQDMAAAVDSGNGSTGTSTDGIQADGGNQEFGSSNEFLFNRVRGAIVRSLKKGGVTSGISNKIR